MAGLRAGGESTGQLPERAGWNSWKRMEKVEGRKAEGAGLTGWKLGEYGASLTGLSVRV